MIQISLTSDCSRHLLRRFWWKFSNEMKISLFLYNVAINLNALIRYWYTFHERCPDHQADIIAHD